MQELNADYHDLNKKTPLFNLFGNKPIMRLLKKIKVISFHKYQYNIGNMPL